MPKREQKGNPQNISSEGNHDRYQTLWRPSTSGYGKKEGYDKADLFCFFLNHDGTVGTNEAGIEVRPYMYYPNPTQDQLHLQYSPDVQPKTIELYDLQGRLVRKQTKDLESVDMQGLASGQYLMKVMLEDGKSYTDKVVKE